MHSRHTRVSMLLGALALLGVAAMGSACSVEESSMLVVGNAFLQDDCVAQPNLEGPFLARGTLDVSIRSQYIMFPVLQNQLGPSEQVRIQAAGAGAGQGSGLDDVLIEGNTIILNEAEVEFELPPGVAGLPSNIRIPTSGTVFPQGVSSAGIELISPNFGQGLAGVVGAGTTLTVLVKVRFFGVTASGTEVESAEFSYPLDICNGCLIAYAPGSLFPTDGNRLTCDPLDQPATVEEVPEEPEPPCIIGQDQPVDCRLCRTLKADEASADAQCDP